MTQRIAAWLIVAAACWSLSPLLAWSADEQRIRADRFEVAERQLSAEAEFLQVQLDSLAEILAAFANDPPSDVVEEHRRTERELDDLLNELASLRGLVSRPPGTPTGASPSQTRARKPIANSLLKFGESFEIAPDEVVRGDATLIGADLWVHGEVLGDAVVVGGDLRLGSEARIAGKAMAVGGRVEASQGATVEGKTIVLSLLPAASGSEARWPGAVSLLFDVLEFGLLMLVAGLLLIVFPKRMSRANSHLHASFAQCFGLGVLMLTGGSFALTVFVMLLSVTLVGIPIALLLALLAAMLLVAAFFVGLLLVGDTLRERFRLGAQAPLASVFIGLLLILFPGLLRDFLGAVGLGDSAPYSWLLPLSLVLVAIPLASGLGAVVLSKFGTTDALEIEAAEHTPLLNTAG